MSVTTTYLEMTSAQDIKPKVCTDQRFHVCKSTIPLWQFNRFLYSYVGGPWQWVDKLPWTAEQWRSYVERKELHTFVGYYSGSPAGYFELEEQDGDVEIAYFGLAEPFIGKKLGGAFLTATLEQAWQLTERRVWVHTCTLDHPASLGNYMARGMRVYKVETE